MLTLTLLTLTAAAITELVSLIRRGQQTVRIELLERRISRQIDSSRRFRREH
jgi:hypothetical protein